MGIDGQLRVVEPQLVNGDLVKPVPQPDDFTAGKKPVPAGNNDMDLFRKPRHQTAQKPCDPVVGEQMKIVDEEIAGKGSCQSVAELIRCLLYTSCG